MKLIILSPNIHLVFSDEQKKCLAWEFEVEYFTTPTPLDSLKSLQSHDEKIVALDPDFCNWKVTRENLEKIKNLRAICLQTTAFHYIDREYLKEKNIPLTNLRGFSTNAVAEQAFAMIFALARKLPMVLREWCVVNFERYRWIELRWRKLWVIWLGRIGSRIAEIASGIGMNVSYWSRNSRNEQFEYQKLSDLLISSDVLVYALAKNDETDNLFSDALLQNLNPRAIFVSIAHIDHPKFISLVEEGNLSGYACDDRIWELWDFSWNILPWAELGWCTDECFRRNGEQWIEAIMDAKNWKFSTQIF